MDTFSGRLESAYGARSREELGELVRDLPPRGRIPRLLAGVVSAVSALSMQLEDAWRRPRIPRLALPTDGRTRVTIGRSPGCDLVLSPATVSRHHAELVREGDDWTLAETAPG